MKQRNALQSAFDGAKAVEFSEDGRVVVAWHGGITFNVFAVPFNGEPLTETTCFSVSDEIGEPVDRETAVRHMTEWLQTNV